MWGRRWSDIRDDSHNTRWVALLTGGEGWHNNAHPASARHGLAYYEFDLSYYGIWFLGTGRAPKKVEIAKFDPRPLGQRSPDAAP